MNTLDSLNLCNHKNIICMVCNKKLKLITLTDPERHIKTTSHNLREKILENTSEIKKSNSAKNWASGFRGVNAIK